MTAISDQIECKCVRQLVNLEIFKQAPIILKLNTATLAENILVDFKFIILPQTSVLLIVEFDGINSEGITISGNHGRVPAPEIAWGKIIEEITVYISTSSDYHFFVQALSLKDEVPQ